MLYGHETLRWYATNKIATCVMSSEMVRFGERGLFLVPHLELGVQENVKTSED